MRSSPPPAYRNIRIALARSALAVALAAFAGTPPGQGRLALLRPRLSDRSRREINEIVASQPKSTVERFCDAIPDAGPAVIALDAPDSELRDLVWDIRILRDKGPNNGEEDPDADTVFHLPAEKHKNGMVNFDVNIKNAGAYILLVEATNDEGARKYVGRHHFTAGLWEPMEIYTVAGFGAVALIGVGFAASRYLAARKAAGGREAAQN